MTDLEWKEIKDWHRAIYQARVARKKKLLEDNIKKQSCADRSMSFVVRFIHIDLDNRIRLKEMREEAKDIVSPAKPLEDPGGFGPR